MFFILHSSGGKRQGNYPRRGVGNGNTLRWYRTGLRSALNVVASAHLLYHLCPGSFYERSAYWKKGCFGGTSKKPTHSCNWKLRTWFPHSLSFWMSSQGFLVLGKTYCTHFMKWICPHYFWHDCDGIWQTWHKQPLLPEFVINSEAQLICGLQSSFRYSCWEPSATERINEPLLTKCSYLNKALCFAVTEKELRFLFVPHFDSLIIFIEARLTLQEL